jgi:hypothetical protein
MTALLKKLLLFLLPLLLLLVLWPIDARWRFQGLKDDCFNHGIWIYDRIHSHPKPIDLVFLGSSRTLNGINDQLISSQWGDREAVNLAYCRFGRNLTFVLLKEVLAERKIETLVVEVRETEDRYSHPVFPFMASTKDVLLPNPVFNKQVVSDMWVHLAYKVELLQDQLYRQESAVVLQTEAYGFASPADTADPALLEEARQRRLQPKVPISDTEYNFHMQFPRRYLQKVGELCKANNIRLVFLYLPAYGDPRRLPTEYNSYLQYGQVLLPPDTVLVPPAHWCDENHLNQTGAAALSNWLAMVLR